ncbi:MAG: DHHA1 domain-containing protein, partial [Candidatus Sulfotelmatobacter sp.]
ELRSWRKQWERSQEELAAAQAAALLAETPEIKGRKIVVQSLADREINFVKLLAQKLTRLSPSAVALLASTSPQPSLVFAQSAGQPFDMGGLMKETMTKLGGRGGGSKDLAQGGLTSTDGIAAALEALAARLGV